MGKPNEEEVVQGMEEALRRSRHRQSSKKKSLRGSHTRDTVGPMEKTTVEKRGAPLSPTFKTATDVLGDRVSDLIAEVDENEVECWYEAIVAAQANCPEDKELFVAKVNRLLDVFGYRIFLDDGQPYRLIVNPGANNKGYIQFAGRRGASRGGFSSANIRLGKLPPDHRRRTAPPSF